MILKEKNHGYKYKGITMKNFIYSILVLGFISVSAVTAKGLIATDPDLTIQANSTDISHSGRTNKDGCHNDRKRGTYHCH